MSYYRVDSRQQDEGWQPDFYAQRERRFMTLADAVVYAEQASRNFLYGMARVVDITENRVIVEFSCGHAPIDVSTMRELGQRMTDIMGSVRPTTRPTDPVFDSHAVDRFVRVHTDVQALEARPSVPLAVPDRRVDYSTPVAENPRNLRGIHVRPRPEKNSEAPT